MPHLRRVPAWTICVFALATVLAAAPRQTASGQPQVTSAPRCADEAPAAFLQWARSTAVTFTATDPTLPAADLSALEPLIGDARVVGIGESVRLTHEFYEVADRLFRVLVERMGFTGFAMETGFAEAVHVNDFVLGRIPEPDNWEHTWFTWWRGSEAELKALVRWMRRYNDDPRHARKLHFYGIDVAVPDSSPRPALDNAFAYLDAHDPAFLSSPIRATLTSLVQKFLGSGGGTEARLVSMNKYRMLSAAERDAYAAGLGDLQSRFETMRLELIRRSSVEAYEWARHSVVAARQLDDAYRATVAAVGADHQITEDTTFLTAMTPVRDRGQADNVMWALEREGDGGRVLVFAHDLHLMKGRLPEGAVQRSAGTARLFETAPRLGLHLQSMLGNRYVNIASTYGDGEPTGWTTPAVPSLATPAACGRLDAELNRVGPALFFLDLRQSRSTPEARDWLNRAHERGYDLNVLDAWDAVLFVRHISPVRR